MVVGGDGEIQRPRMKELIQQRLKDMEREHGIQVLYAVESGSRCWGFASPNSDWDVRFIYVRPVSWYLSIGDRRDVVEQLGPDDLDLAGWDLRKALRLFKGSNPSLLEWLHSPIVYVEQGTIAKELRALHALHTDQRAQMHHYRNLAWGNYQKYLHGRTAVNLKRYFYVLRALFACMMVERNGRLDSTVFNDHLQDIIPAGPVRRAVDDLLLKKVAGDELCNADRIGVIDDWIDEAFAYYNTDVMSALPVSERIPTEVLDVLFRNQVYRW